MSWRKSLKGRISLNEPLSKHTAFKIGGPAGFFIEPEGPGDIKTLLRISKKKRLPFFIIGAGSNLLVSDKGIKGMVIRLSAPYFRKLSRENESVYAASGIMLNKLLAFAKERGLSGAEFLAGIPGTVGGALAMNAGVTRPAARSIGDLVKEVKVMDRDGNIKALKKKDIKFGYRESSLSEYLILSSVLILKKQDKRKIEEKMRSYLERRKSTQELMKPSAGCIFKNPRSGSAGRLIDLCGMKGKRAGGAQVSRKHANFILNSGRAKAKDVLKLMDSIIEKVEAEFNIHLEPEIKIWR